MEIKANRPGSWVWFKLGPVHLYETSGRYYLYEILRESNVILFASNDFLHCKRFDLKSELSERGNIKIIYYNKCRSIRRCWSDLNNLNHQLSSVRSLPIDAFYTVDICYPETHILLLVSHIINPIRKIYVLQTSACLKGIQLENLNKSRLHFWSQQLKENVEKSFSFKMPNNFVNIAYVLFSQFRDFLAYKLVPFLLLKHFSYPYLSPASLKYYPQNLKKKYQANHVYYVFGDEDQKFYLSLGFSTVQLIRHPARNYFQDHSNGLASILILPDYRPLISIYNGSNRLVTNSSDIINKLLALFNVLESFKAIKFQVTVKLHPRAILDEEWQVVIEECSVQCPYISFIYDEQDAQSLISSNSIILGETSSSLEWSSLVFPSKLTISHNIFGLHDMRSFSSGYKNIYYSSDDLSLLAIIQSREYNCN